MPSLRTLNVHCVANIGRVLEPEPNVRVRRVQPGVPAARTLRGGVEIRHFDPYSVVLRLIARGDEPDYVAALEYVLHEWVEPARLEGLLPRSYRA